MMPSPLTNNHNHHRRRCRSVIAVSLLLSWTYCCEFSTAFTPIYSLTSIHTSSSTSAAAPTDFSCATNLSNHHHLISIKSTTTATHLQLFKKKHSPLEDEPWKKDDSYWDQLQAASKDPEQFEKFIEDTMAKKKNPSSASSSSSSSLASAYASAKQEEKPKKKGAYVPIEEWDASRSKKENMSSEERLQWECQQGGNRYRQNEILMHNLKSF
eukprot:scaffold5917_cov135-Skeletonema_menzelii.AAC.8